MSIVGGFRVVFQRKCQIELKIMDDAVISKLNEEQRMRKEIENLTVKIMVKVSRTSKTDTNMTG